MASRPHPDLPAPTDGEPSAQAPPAVQQALDAMNRLCSGELDFAVGYARLAGLETAVVLAITPGGLVPLFAHVTPDVFPVLFPASVDTDPESARVAAAARLN
jgi:hypothetical protein